jgi:hypothetical protein
MSSSSVASEISEPFDIHGYFASPITLYHILVLNDLSDTIDIVAIKVITVHGVGQINFIKNFAR